MAEGDELTTVWCEADDDITLVWQRRAAPASPPVAEGPLSVASSGASAAAKQGNGALSETQTVEVEFVQVKGNEHNQLWSASLLCQPKRGRKGQKLSASSILEKSLLRDAYREPSRFRVVSVRPVNSELKPLELPIDHTMRQPASPEYQALAARLPAHVKKVKSPNGNTWTYWIARALWDVRHSDAAVRDRNLHRLEQVLRGLQGYLAPDQREMVYERLVRRAFDAALARRLTQRERKRLRREDVIAILRAAVTDAQRAGEDDDSLEAALHGAGLSLETVRHARDSRLRYLNARRTPRYFVVADRERVEQLEEEVGARLHTLWARLESGLIDEPPSAFYHRCLAELEAIRRERGTDAPSLDLLQGMLYERVHRRMLRFDRVAS
jgi:hypothetical protein